MRSIHRATSRALITAAAAAPGSTAVLTFRIPGESESGSPTTGFSVALPNMASAQTEVLPGWTARLDRDAAAGTVRAVTWTAAPSAGISADQFGLFRISVTLPDEPSVTLPATQTYSDGEVVRWDQAPLPGGAEPEYPAPVLDLGAGGGGEAPDHRGESVAAPVAAPDDTARWLAGGALILAAVGTVAAIAGRRRS